MTSDTRQIIWTSSLDLSPEGVSAFCKTNAQRYGKTEAELKNLPLMDLAIRYMRSEQNRALRQLKKQLNVDASFPVLIILDKADFCNRSHMECFLLSDEKLSGIFSCAQDGLSITFYTDGRDIRCESLTSLGADHYLFREVTNLHNLSDLIKRIKRGEALTESELAQNTQSLLPCFSSLLNIPLSDHPTLAIQIQNSQSRPASTKPHALPQHEISGR